MVLLLAACGLAPSARLGDLTVESLTLDGATASLAVTVDNPWPVAPTADARWALVVDGTTVASGEAADLAVAARDETTVAVPIAWRWADLWAAAGAVGREVPYRAEVVLQGEHALGEWTLPLRVEGTLPALEIPEVGLLGWRIDEISPFRLAGTLIVGITGPLPLTDLSWVATLGGRTVARGGLTVGAGSIELPVAIELAAFPEAAWYAYEKGGSLAVDGGVDTPLGRLPVRWSLGF
jgi:hypothetical protein